MRWFDEVFLPSIFESMGNVPGSCRWLTVKQTNVCTNNMHQKAQAYDTDGYGERSYNHLVYSYTWQGREVVLQYSKKSHTGSITFGPTQQEVEKANAERKKREEQKKEEYITRIRNNPRMLARHVNRLEKEVEYYKAMVDVVERELQGPDHDEGSESDIKFYREKLREASTMLERLLQ